MIRKSLQIFKEVEKKPRYLKVPIEYPRGIADEPRAEDFEMLKVSQEVTNRELVMAFRQLSFQVHPANDTSVKANQRYLELVQAYDRIVMYRMAQDGVPRPYSEAYYPPATHTRVVKQFLDENAFWTPHVWENYTAVLFWFWAGFGALHTLLQIYNPFLLDQSL